MRHRERYTMLCPRCGNEWDASRSSFSSCGFRVRAASPTASTSSADLAQRGGISQGLTFTPNQPSGNGPMARQQRGGASLGGPTVSTPNSNQLPANTHTSGSNWPSSRQNSGSLPAVKKQTEGQSAPPLPNTPRPMFPSPSSLIPQRDPGVHMDGPLSTNDATMRPAFEKNALRKVSSARDAEAGQAHTQSPFPPGNAATSFGTMPQAWPRPSTQQMPDDIRQEMPRSQAQPMTQRRPPARFDGGATVRGASRPSMASGEAAHRQPIGSNAATRATNQSLNARPLTPGVQLRGNRYRLQELLERQDWLSGVFEAVWIGRDSQRGGQQVVIREVALPETTSVMSQSILRTATMALANVGRHPRIPALWDAFSDQGRSFFVFEPIEGETLMGRMRYSGRTLPEQEVIECCLQLTEVLDLLSQQSPQMVHGLIRPEHIVLSRNNSHYILTNFSVVLAGGATQYIAGMERTLLSPYTAPEFVRGVLDVRTDKYSLIATAYHAVTGSAPAGISGNIPQAQLINPNVSSACDAILSKWLRTVPNQRYQRPSELRQDLLAMRSVIGTLVPGRGSNPVFQSSNPTFVSKNGQQTHVPTQQTTDQVAQALPLLLNTNDDMEEPVL